MVGAKMNANELADGILAIEERIFLTKKEHQLFQNSATMLRQQQAEIEALKKEAALQRLSDFTQEADNEPVAWMELYYGEPNNLAWTDAELKDSGEVYKTVPLYTHPLKELTDAEIRHIQAICHLKDVGYDNFIMRFARAILRKAQYERK
jgi:hypothetical protein